MGRKERKHRIGEGKGRWDRETQGKEDTCYLERRGSTVFCICTKIYRYIQIRTYIIQTWILLRTHAESRNIFW